MLRAAAPGPALGADAVVVERSAVGDLELAVLRAAHARIETLNDPLLLTTDADFRVYRRQGRRTIPCVLPH